jgi:hypothetical protein
MGEHQFDIVRPNVIVAPSKYHASTVATVELEFPLHGLWRRDRWVILDGIHRLVRADLAGHTSVSVITLSIRDVATIAAVSMSRSDLGGGAGDVGCRPGSSATDPGSG